MAIITIIIIIISAGTVIDANDPGTDLEPRYIFKLPSAGMR